MAKRKPNPVRVSGPIDPGKSGRAQFRTVVNQGRHVRVRVIDVNDSNFAAQFLSSFRSNVRKARRENRELVEKG